MMMLSSMKKNNKTTGYHLNTLNSESLKVGLKTHKRKTKYTTNYIANSEDILIDPEELKQWQNPDNSDKPHTSKILQNNTFMSGSEQRGAALEK